MLKRLGRAIEGLVGSDVHPGEWRLVLAFVINLFLLLTAYYILKVLREPLILLGGGAVSRSYARGLQAGLLALARTCRSADGLRLLRVARDLQHAVDRAVLVAGDRSAVRGRWQAAVPAGRRGGDGRRHRGGPDRRPSG